MKYLWHLLLAVVIPCQAESDLEQRLTDQAHRYIKSLSVDFEAQRDFYTEQTVFEDITAESFGQRWRFVGADQIMDFWKRSFEGYGTLKVRPEIRETIVQPPFVVVNYTAHVTACAVAIGQPSKVFTGPLKMVTALKIVDGKVISHTDYGAYDAANRQLDEIADQLKKQPDDPRCERFVKKE